MKDFYLKLYDKHKNIKKFDKKEIIEKSDFSASINSSYSEFKIKIKSKINNNDFQIWDFTKFFYKNKLYFEWFIFYIERKIDYSWEFLEISFLSPWNYISNWKFESIWMEKDFKTLYFWILEKCNEFFWIEILKNWIDLKFFENPEFNKKIDISRWEYNFLSYLQHIFKEIWVDFFIDFDWKIKVSWESYFLTIWKNIDEMIISETWEEIKNNSLKNKTTLNINNNFNFWNLKPLDEIKILNLSYKIGKKKISKISYSEKKASVSLENYDSFSNLIKNLW